MKVSVLQENLLNALQIVSRGVSTKPQLPILSCVLFQAKDGGITLSSTDLSVGVRIVVGGKVEEEGECAVPAKIFLEYIASLSPGAVEMSVVENRLTILTKGSKTSLQLMIADEFPRLPAKETAGTTIKKEEFLQALNFGSLASGTDDTRPVFSSLYLEKEESGELSCVSTDGYRLSKVMTKISAGWDKSLMLQSKIVREIQRLSAKLPASEIVLGISESSGQFFLNIGDAEFSLRVVDGEFPNYRAIIPPEFQTQVFLPREEFVKIVRSALIFCKDSSEIIKMSLVGGEKDGELKIAAASGAVGEFAASMPIECAQPMDSGDEKKISFNGRYLLDFLTNVSSDRVWFGMNETLKPGMFRAENVDNFFYVVMPFRVQE